MEIPPQRLEVASAGGKTREKGPPATAPSLRKQRRPNRT